MTDAPDRRSVLKGAAASAALLAPAAGARPVPPRQRPRGDRRARSTPASRNRCAASGNGSRCRPSPPSSCNIQEGADHMARLATEAGFTGVRKVPTGGVPAVFGVLDAGAQRTVGIYFMYDVKQFDPAEWASPPLEGRIFDHAARPRDPRPRRGQPEGAGRRLPRRAARLQGGGQEAAGQPRPARRRRGGDRLAQFPATSSRMPRCSRRCAGRAASSSRRPAQGANGAVHDQPRRQGHHRVRADLVGRALGQGPGARRPFQPQGAGRQPGLAPGRGACPAWSPTMATGRRSTAGSSMSGR